MAPLRHRGARHRRAERFARVGHDPAADPLNATPIDPVLHVTAFDHMPAELPTHLTSAERFRDPATGRVVRRRVPLWVRRANGYERPLGLVPLVDQSLRRRSNGSPLPPVGPATAAFADCADPLVPVVLAARRRALVRVLHRGTGRGGPCTTRSSRARTARSGPAR